MTVDQIVINLASRNNLSKIAMLKGYELGTAFLHEANLLQFYLSPFCHLIYTRPQSPKTGITRFELQRIVVPWQGVIFEGDPVQLTVDCMLKDRKCPCVTKG